MKLALLPNSQRLHPTEAYRTGSNQRLVGHGGHINANNKQDLVAGLRDLVTRMESGDIQQKPQAPVEVMSTTEKNIALSAAYADYDSKDFALIGSGIADAIYQSATREGFMRNMLKRLPLAQGQFARIPIIQKTTVAFEASSPAMIQPTQARNSYFMPTEFRVDAHIQISELEIAQTTEDLLDIKLNEGYEAVQVREDRTLKLLLDAAVGQSNALVTIVGGITPQILAPLRMEVSRWNVPVANMLFASDVWIDFTTNTPFTSFYDPVSQYEVVQTGMLGTLFGMNLMSDNFKVPTQKVLNQGEIYITTTPDYLGCYTDRGPLTANEVNYSQAGWGTPARGWHLWELISMMVANPRGVAKAIRS